MPAPEVIAAPVVDAPIVDDEQSKSAPVSDGKPSDLTAKVEAPKIDPLEKEVAEKWGDEWEKASPKIRERALEAERKTREADKRFQQIAKIQKDHDLTQKQMAQLVEALKKDPKAVLQNKALGLDIHKLAEDILWEKLQRDQMDPKDREIAEYKAREAERQRIEEEAEAERVKAETAKRIEEARAKYKSMIDSAISSEKLPNTPKIVSQMAYYMKLYSQAGKEIDMKAISAQVRKDHIDWQAQFLDSMPDDQLLTSIPKSVIDRLRKADLAELRAKGLAPKPGPKPESKPKETSKKTETTEEWLARMKAERGR